MYFNGENDKYEYSEEEFRTQYLGEPIGPLCAVMDNKEVHCPEKPEYFFEIEDETVGLCEYCYRSYQEGAYDKRESKRGIVPVLKIVGKRIQKLLR